MTKRIEIFLSMTSAEHALQKQIAEAELALEKLKKELTTSALANPALKYAQDISEDRNIPVVEVYGQNRFRIAFGIREEVAPYVAPAPHPRQGKPRLNLSDKMVTNLLHSPSLLTKEGKQRLIRALDPAMPEIIDGGDELFVAAVKRLVAATYRLNNVADDDGAHAAIVAVEELLPMVAL